MSHCIEALHDHVTVTMLKGMYRYIYSIKNITPAFQHCHGHIMVMQSHYLKNNNISSETKTISGTY